MTKRRICWPNPDATCLEGGCGYCNANSFKSHNTIEKYIAANPLLFNRSGKTAAVSWEAWTYGIANRFFNVQTKE